MFTINQKKAIDLEGKNILVSAGAGSGKTTVLTQRIIRKLKEGTDINKMLVLTFTNAAASEMKQRIKKAIIEDGNLDEQIPLVDIADISTFDAFLLKLVKKYSYEIDLDSNIIIGDSITLEKKLDDTIEEVFNSIYDNMEYEKDNPYFNLFNNYFVFNDNDLKDNIKEIYYSYVNILDKKEIKNLIKDEQIELFFKQYEKYLIGLSKDIYNILIEIKKDINCVKGEEYYNKIFENLECFNFISDYNTLVNIIEEGISVRKSSSKAIENKEEINQKIELIQNKINYIKSSIILKSKEEIIKEEKEKYEVKRALFEILDNIKYKLECEKKKDKVFDFSDILNLAIEILENKEILKEVKNNYIEILVDEYQDTNDFQNYFINLISNDNLYLVGDVKQSIYGFRNANPKNFNDIQESYNKSDKGTVINLLDNFRSKKDVLKGVNDTFSQLMIKKVGDIDYNDNHALDYGNKSYDLEEKNQIYGVEFYDYSTENISENNKLSHNKEIEPYIIANDIIKKINSSYKVGCGKLRDCKYSDFVILTRNKTNYEHYNKVFEFFKIPIDIQMEDYLNDKYNYDILTLLSIFKLIYFKNDNLSKLSLMRSFLYELDEQKIYDYIVNEKTCKEIEEIESKIKNIKSKNFYNLELLLEEIFDEFNFFDKVVELESVVGLNQRLIKLKQIARSYTQEGKNIKDLIEYLEYSLEEKTKLEVEIEKPEIDTVKVMTIHKSKGLEFNIIYLSSFDTNIFKSSTSRINLNNKYSLILPKIENYQKENSFLKYLATIEIQNKEINESIRLLYVAMTRAKEKIIFLNDIDKESSKSNINSLETIKKFRDLVYLSNNKKVFKYIEDINYEKSKEIKTSIPNNLDIEFKSVKLEKKVIKKQKFSKDINNLITPDQRKNIDLGIYFHECLELINISRLKDKKYVDQIIKSLDNDILKEIIISLSKQDFVKNIVNYWTEYEFYYEDDQVSVNGIIDLLIETEDFVYIIDYKLSNIEAKEYEEQLKNYKKCMEQYFNKEIKCYLYSLLNKNIKEVK